MLFQVPILVNRKSCGLNKSAVDNVAFDDSRIAAAPRPLGNYFEGCDGGSRWRFGALQKDDLLSKAEVRADRIAWGIIFLDVDLRMDDGDACGMQEMISGQMQ